MTMYYEAKGRIRGRCGHKHKSFFAAEKCCKRDMEGCKSQGGYSDRFVSEVEVTPIAKIVELKNEVRVCAGEKGKGRIISCCLWSGNLGRSAALSQVIATAESQGYEVIDSE